MATTPSHPVLIEALGPQSGVALTVKRVALVVIGIAALALAAKIKIPFWPVPATLQTLAVLSIGAAYGVRLGGVTLLGYLALGALGADVFTGSSATSHGLAYMMGGTGGYLLGFFLATLALGGLARAGWDRSPGLMALAMGIGLVLVYAPGIAWLGVLFAETKGWAWVIEVGLGVFLVAEAVKLALAAMLFPALWRLVGDARA